MDALQERILRRNAWRLLPLLTVAYVINYLDRTNVSFAALTMNKDLGLTATQYGRGAGIFFLAYCRSGLLSGHCLLSLRLVPGAVPGAHPRRIPGRNPVLHRDRRAGFRPHT